jgi:hypothetical protein
MAKWSPRMAVRELSSSSSSSTIGVPAGMTQQACAGAAAGAAAGGAAGSLAQAAGLATASAAAARMIFTLPPNTVTPANPQGCPRDVFPRDLREGGKAARLRQAPNPGRVDFAAIQHDLSFTSAGGDPCYGSTVTDSLTHLDLFVRGIGVGALVVFAFGVLRSAASRHARVVVTVTCLAITCWLITESGELWSVFGFTRFLLPPANAVGGLFWLFVLTVFDDRRPTPLLWAPTALLAATALTITLTPRPRTGSGPGETSSADCWRCTRPW